MAGNDEKKTRARRHYRPTVEGLEVLRLLSGATQANPLAGLAVERDMLADPLQHPLPMADAPPSTSISSATWDAALVQTHLAGFLSSTAAAGTTAASSSSTDADPEAIASGLSQLNKYLSRAWFRAGIPASIHDDNTQAVYATLLQNLGRQRFDALVGDVGHWGVKDVFSRETSDGLAFFRAVDMVKKRAQRERVHQSLDSVDVPTAARDQGSGASLRDALREAIDQTLSPREAALIHDTLMGKTPAEIALQWGVAPKTVSNEKTRVLQKLRDALVNHEMN